MNKHLLLKKIPFMALIFVVTIFVILIVFQRSFIYLRGGYPGTPETAGFKEIAEVSFETDDELKLFSWYIKPQINPMTEEINPTILYFHGNRPHVGFYVHKIKELAQKGLGVFMLEYRGYGGNPGRPSETGLMLDGKGAVAFLETQGTALDHLIFYGEDLGAGIATALAAAYHPQGLILESPFTSKSDIIRYYWPHLPVELILFDKFDSLSVIEQIKTPLLIIHGQKNKKIPYQMSEKLIQKAQEPKMLHLIEEADHKNIHKYNSLKIIYDWIRSINCSTK